MEDSVVACPRLYSGADPGTALPSGVHVGFGGDGYAGPAGHQGAASSRACSGFVAAHLTAFSDPSVHDERDPGDGHSVYAMDDDVRAVGDHRTRGASGSRLDDEALVTYFCLLLYEYA